MRIRWKSTLLLALLTMPVHHTPAQATDPNMARALRVLRTAPVFDGHNDLPWRIREDTVHPMDVEAYDIRTRAPGMTDLPRLKQGHVGAQFWSIYIPGERADGAYKQNGEVSSVPGYARVQLEQIDIARRVIAKYPQFVWAPTAAAVCRNRLRFISIVSSSGCWAETPTRVNVSRHCVLSACDCCACAAYSRMTRSRRCARNSLNARVSCSASARGY